MTETKHKEHITSEHFGIPADFADRVANYAAWRVQALSEQLTEAQALIEASRKQEAVAWMRKDGDMITALEKRPDYAYTHYYDRPLYAAPVVAYDALAAAVKEKKEMLK